MNLRELKASLATDNVSYGKSTYLCQFQWNRVFFLFAFSYFAVDDRKLWVSFNSSFLSSGCRKHLAKQTVLVTRGSHNLGIFILLRGKIAIYLSLVAHLFSLSIMQRLSRSCRDLQNITCDQCTSMHTLLKCQAASTLGTVLVAGNILKILATSGRSKHFCLSLLCPLRGKGQDPQAGAS